MGLFDSFFLQKTSKADFYGVPRTNKRIHYYLLKVNMIRHNKNNNTRVYQHDIEHEIYS